MKLNILNTSENIILVCSGLVVDLKMPISGCGDKIPGRVSSAVHCTSL